MSHKIVFLNGPPKSGKDTAGKALVEHLGGTIRLYQMKRPIIKALCGFYNIDMETWNAWQAHKDTPSDVYFNGKTLRDVMISFSEDWVKKLYGSEAFGEFAVRYLAPKTSTIATIITDSGFKSEAEPIVQHFGVKNCLLIHLHRPGTSFERDSRSYWDMPDLLTIDVHNQYELDIYALQMARTVQKFIQGQMQTRSGPRENAVRDA